MTTESTEPTVEGVQITANPFSWVAAILRWLFRQPARDVSFIVIMAANLSIQAALMYGGWLAVTEIIPSHIKEISAGHQVIAAELREGYARQRQIEIDADERRYELIRELWKQFGPKQAAAVLELDPFGAEEAEVEAEH